MKKLLKAADRGHFDHGWLKTWHTFSFGEYFDPAYKSFRSLRVMNDDRVAPASGFGMHPHRDMEIVTYILEGALEHKDSMGNGSVIRAGDLQRMTAGTGVEHSEFNPSPNEWAHLYQIWLFPEKKGLKPGYEQLSVGTGQATGELRLVASREGEPGTLTIHQDARIYLASLDAGQTVRHEVRAGRHAWLQVLRGRVMVDDASLETGDGLAISDERSLSVTAHGDCEFLLFDLA
jgi:redox-sensitive bicupin YhaK (pirin superfamily)